MVENKGWVQNGLWGGKRGGVEIVAGNKEQKLGRGSRTCDGYKMSHDVAKDGGNNG